jgi:hypothetical protein
MINPTLKSSTALAVGFLSLLTLSACDTKKTPTETAQAFWSALAKNQTEQAKEYCSSQSQIISTSNTQQFQQAPIAFGKIIIDGLQATVETQFTPVSQKKVSLSTFLVKEDDSWKIDCKRSTALPLGSDLVNDFFNSLNELGENINKQLEQQIPLIEKEIESFGQELKQQIDHLNNDLKQSLSQQKQQSNHKKSI